MTIERLVVMNPAVFILARRILRKCSGLKGMKEGLMVMIEKRKTEVVR
jgi:hypothetical protein